MANRSSVRLAILFAVLATGLVFLARSFLSTDAPTIDVGASVESESTPTASLHTATSVSAIPAVPAPTPAAEVEPSSSSNRAVAATAEELELADAIWVTGSVRFPEHTPLGETVEVIANGKKFKTREMHRARVNPDGTFRVAFSKDTRTGRLAIDAPHLYLSTPLSIKPATAASGHVLEPEVGGRILGVIVPPVGVAEASAELQKSSVRLFGWQPGAGNEQIDRTSKIDANLRFELRGIPPDLRCNVSCQTRSYADSSSDNVAVAVGVDTPLELRLTRGVRLSGRLIDEAGQALAGVAMGVEIEREGGRGSSSSSGEMNDAKDGSFDLRGKEPGKITLSAKKKGFQDAKLELGELVDGDVREGLELRLSSGLFVAGRVLWPDGRPVLKATVSAVPLKKRDDNEWRRPDDVQFTTAADGSFRISGLEQGPLIVAASASVRAEAAQKEAVPDAPADAARDAQAEAEKQPAKKSLARGPRWTARLENIEPGNDALVLTLQPGYALSGRVVDDSGAPIQRFQVVATPQSPEDGPRNLLTSAVQARFNNEDGSFTLEGVHAGAWTVLVNAKGFLSGEGVGVVVPERLALGSLVVARVALLRGQVFGPDGAPMAKARVELKLPRANNARRVFSSRSDSDVICDAKGQFEFKSAPSGDYMLHATRDGFAGSDPLPVSVAPGQTIDGLSLTLHRGGRLVVELLASNGAKTSGRQISIYPRFDGGDWREARTDATGHATLEGLSAGQWQVSAEPSEEELKELGPQTDENDWAARSSLQKTAVATIVEGETARVVLGAPPAAPVEIRGIVHSGGAPVAGARVQAFFQGDAGGGQQKFARCDDKGAYRLSVDQPGKYSFSASREGATPTRWRQVDVPAGPSYQLDLELSAGSISGRVLGPDGAPVAEASVMLGMDQNAAQRRSDGVGGFVQTDKSGEFRFDDLPAGVYTVTAMGDRRSSNDGAPPLSRESVKGLTLEEGGALRDVTLRLSVGGILQGLVRDSAGKPAPRTVVYFRDSAGAVREDMAAFTDETGHYLCRGITPGTWTAHAAKESEVSVESVSVRVAVNETTQLDLEMRVGCMLSVEILDRDGTPVGAAINVVDDRGREQAVRGAPSAEGSKTQKVGPLAPGKYTVTAFNHDGVEASATISLSGETTRTLQLKLGG